MPDRTRRHQSPRAPGQPPRGRHLGLATLLLLLPLAGCATGSHHREGPEWRSHSGHTFVSAVTDPAFWIPAVGAVAFTIDDWDEKVSDWAIDHHPLFGSEDGADRASDIFEAALGVAALTTFIVAPEDERRRGPLRDTYLYRGLVELGAFGASTGVAELLKETVDRRKPDSLFVEASFPSGHVTESSSFRTLLSRNVARLDPSPAARITAEAGSQVTLGLVAWARIEAGEHFPSDVLAGAAIGNFVTAFIHDFLLGQPEDIDLGVEVQQGTVMAGVTLRF